jgi:CD109 antigen
LPVTPDSFYEKQFLSVESATFSTLIQTNKVTYRPGEKVKYRVITVDSDTRPVDMPNACTISFIDPSENVVAMSANQSTVNGVCAGEFQIAEDDETGSYEIETECKDKVRLDAKVQTAEAHLSFHSRKRKKPWKSAMPRTTTSRWPL